ncbi:hypothetical protein [Actinomadura monticuli]|uniref:Uncharacterized protein n=1 Tax=Actinomadura monticuli TaxID=3097367 RepID=A0ABV4QEM1_9ACTN
MHGRPAPPTETTISSASDLSALDPSAATLRRAVIDPYQAVVLATALGLDVRE